MELTPEKLRFIHGEQKSPPAPAGPPTPSPAPSAKAIEVEGQSNEFDSVEIRESPSPTSRRARPRHSSHQPVPIAVPDSWRVPITTKLEYGTAQALRRAYLQQKLNHATPATQQEIVELAVQDWLRRNGFLSQQQS